ncbi:MAG: hypothetical protein ACJ72A_20800, partial [Nocardioidaceae bacterium]
MTDSTTDLLNRLIGDEASATADVLLAAKTSRSPSLLVAAALVGLGPDAVQRAGALATTSRDRQLVALGAAYLSGDTGRLDVLVREHLSDHPDNVLASWIAGRPPHRPTSQGSTP